MLPIICIALVLRLGHATGGAHVLTCCGLWQQLVAVATLPCEIWMSENWLIAKFQDNIVYCVTVQCRKRLEACIHAEGGHSEHLLWLCLPDIPVATHHNRFFSEPPMTAHNWLFSEPPMFERMQQTFRQMKKFIIIFRSYYGDIQVCGQVDYSLFFSEITKIIRSMCK